MKKKENKDFLPFKLASSLHGAPFRYGGYYESSDYLPEKHLAGFRRYHLRLSSQMSRNAVNRDVVQSLVPKRMGNVFPCNGCSNPTWLASNPSRQEACQRTVVRSINRHGGARITVGRWLPKETSIRGTSSRSTRISSTWCY